VIIERENQYLSLSGVFFVNPEDFNIKIPAIVQEKIANEVQIIIDYQLIEKK